MEQVISEGPEALKKYIASGAIEELHDVMPHDDDNDYLNDAYLDDDDDVPTPSATLDVALPTPLQSAKMSLSQNQMSLSAQMQLQANQDSKDKPRKSRFSDINDVESNMDLDMRSMHPAEDSYGNGRMNDMKNNFRDVDYRNTGSRMDFDKNDEEIMYGKNFENQNSRSMDVDFRNRFDNFSSGDSPKFTGNSYGDRDSSWNPNDFGKQGSNSNSNDQFGFRSSGTNFNNSQNGSFGSTGPQGTSGLPGSFAHNNFRHGSDFRGQTPSGVPSQGAPPFGNNFRPEGSTQFRPEGNWSSLPPRPDNFRNRGNFNQRMPMRGGPVRNPRGFPGPRGGMWLPPPRGNGPPPPHSRGRNVF